MTKTTDNASSSQSPPGLLAGVGVAAAVVAAIAGWIALGSALLSETSLFGGLLMLWYWATVEQLSLKRLPHSLAGALVGIGLAWGMFYGASQYGAAGLGVGLFFLVLAIYLDITKIVPLFVNGATMLYSIVAAAPLIQLKIDWIALCLATIGGALFFGTFVSVIGWIGRKSSS